ncbi:hypothetical protein [Sporomusa aerivorans]|uniref:hypothetical protein n=1 Tax=Sporomusa aerivorans TaxID=204936 RepID=UPI003529F9B2
MTKNGISYAFEKLVIMRTNAIEQEVIEKIDWRADEDRRRELQKKIDVCLKENGLVEAARELYEIDSKRGCMLHHEIYCKALKDFIDLEDILRRN